jgi:hypothetical protein
VLAMGLTGFDEYKEICGYILPTQGAYLSTRLGTSYHLYPFSWYQEKNVEQIQLDVMINVNVLKVCELNVWLNAWLNAF